MDMLQILVILVVSFMGIVSALMNFIEARKERKRQIIAEQELRASNRKRTMNYFLESFEQELIGNE